MRLVTVVIHILLWLSIAPGSTLSTEDTVPVSNAVNSSGASCAFEAFRPNDRDLIRCIDPDVGGPFTYGEWKAGLKILQDVRQKGTTWSVVYSLKSKELYFSVYQNWDKVYHLREF